MRGSALIWAKYVLVWAAIAVGAHVLLTLAMPTSRWQTRLAMAGVFALAAHAADYAFWRYVIVDQAMSAFSEYVADRRADDALLKPDRFEVGYVSPAELRQACAWYCFSERMFSRVAKLYTSEGSELHRLYQVCPPGRTCIDIEKFDAVMDTLPDDQLDYGTLRGARDRQCIETVYALFYRMQFCNDATLMAGQLRQVNYNTYIESSLLGRIYESPAWEMSSRAWVSFDFAKDLCAVGGDTADRGWAATEGCIYV